MKRALVTGGSSPIGAAIAERLAGAWLHVIVHANSNLDAADATVGRIRQAGASAESLAIDLTDGDSAEAILTRLTETAPVQILVHNAGLHSDAPFAGMSPDQWHKVIDVNLNGLFAVLRPLIMPMIRSRWSRVVAISSLTAVIGNRGQTNYAAAKGGLLAFVKSLGREYCSRGLTANVVAPGLISTPETEAMENFEHLRDLCPARRPGTPGEVAAIVGFLVSEDAGYISGQQIAVDGGTS